MKIIFNVWELLFGINKVNLSCVISSLLSNRSNVIYSGYHMIQSFKQKANQIVANGKSTKCKICRKNKYEINLIIISFQKYETTNACSIVHE